MLPAVKWVAKDVTQGLFKLPDLATNTHFSLNYSSCATTGPNGSIRPCEHGAHAQVALFQERVGVVPNFENCALCKTNPMSCPWDCSNTDPNDGSLTVYIGMQDPKVNNKNVAYFTVGDQAFPLRGGLCVVFNGHKCPHGTQPPMEPDTTRFPWYGAAIVSRA